MRILKHNAPTEAKVSILAQKLKEFGVNAELLLSPPSTQSVTFTFVGPAGLIEGGSN